MFRSLIVACGFLFGMGTAYAQVSVFPVSPMQFETVRVRVPTGALGIDQFGHGDFYSIGDTQVSMDGNQITVSLLMVGNNGFELQFSPPVDMPIGQFPAGTYTVQIIKRAVGPGSSGPVGSTSFEVISRNTAAPIWDFTDLWWNRNESGWGFNIIQHPSGIIFATWFVYGQDGRPTWYFIPEGTWATPTEYRGPIYKTTGPFFGGVFDPSAVTVTLAGSAILGFNPFDYNRATFVLTADGITVNKDVERQSF